MKAWLKDIAIALVIGILIIQFIKPTIVKEHSMMPTLNENDYIFLSRQAYNLFGDPAYGDIIVFHSDLTRENGKEKLLIKRVIGMPGDVLDIIDGVVYRNGEALDEPYLMEPFTSGSLEGFVVPEGSIFAMGDNRQSSMDSRSENVGCVAIEDIMGKAVLRLYPFSEAGGLYK